MSLCYNPSANSIIVNIIKARNLKAMDIGGTSGAGWGTEGNQGMGCVGTLSSREQEERDALSCSSLASSPAAMLTLTDLGQGAHLNLSSPRC